MVHPALPSSVSRRNNTSVQRNGAHHPNCEALFIEMDRRKIWPTSQLSFGIHRTTAHSKSPISPRMSSMCHCVSFIEEPVRLAFSFVGTSINDKELSAHPYIVRPTETIKGFTSDILAPYGSLWHTLLLNRKRLRFTAILADAVPTCDRCGNNSQHVLLQKQHAGCIFACTMDDIPSYSTQTNIPMDLAEAVPLFLNVYSPFHFLSVAHWWKRWASSLSRHRSPPEWRKKIYRTRNDCMICYLLLLHAQMIFIKWMAMFYYICPCAGAFVLD